jgi:predicted phage terminase large subunit-like protein
VLEPATPFVAGWHLDAICEHLESVSRGEIRNLLINVPPRHMKSLAVCVFWPAWEWISHPERRWLFASYALSLSERDSLKCRRLIESPWYQQHWGNRFQLCGDQNTKLRYENDKTGHRIASSVDGSATGEGGDRVVVDDPHNVIDRESDAERARTLIWWDETMSTRLNDPKNGAKVIVMQRIHEKDLSGHVLAQGGYDHLCLPAEFEPSRRCVTRIPWHDPRQQQNDLLWLPRIGPAELAEYKTRLGPEGYAGQFQQRPAPAGGARFKAEWFRYFRTEDSGLRTELESLRPPSSLSPQSSALGPAPCYFRTEDSGLRTELENLRPPSLLGPQSSALSPAPYALERPGGGAELVPAQTCHRFAVMDPAGTEPGAGRRPCYTVIQVWDITPGGDMLLVYQYRRQVQAPDAAAAAVRICREFDVAYIAIEKDGMGLGVVQQVRREDVTVRAIKARGPKEVRSETAEIRMAAGQIYFPRGAAFLFELEQELVQFPKSEYADQVDALSHAAILVGRIATRAGFDEEDANAGAAADAEREWEPV